MDQRDALIAGAAIAALLLWSRRAQASTPGADIVFTGEMQDPVSSDPSADYFDPVYGDAWEGDAPELLDAGSFEPQIDEWELYGVGLPTDTYAGPAMEPADDPQVKALLYAIRWAEHYPARVMTGEDYRTFVGNTLFSSLADHPVNTGEKKGLPLTAAQCRAAGYASGKCVSTAAGAYQLIRPTWNRLRQKFPPLPDFSARSQDIAAARLLEEIGAVRALHAGDVHSAIALAAGQWASLPGSTAGQGGKSLAFVLSKFAEGGGVA